MMNVFITLIVTVVSGVYTHVRTYQIEHFMCCLLHISRTTIKIKTALAISPPLLTYLRLVPKFARF